MRDDGGKVEGTVKVVTGARQQPTEGVCAVYEHLAAVCQVVDDVIEELDG